MLSPEEVAHDAYTEMIVKACRTNIISARRIAKRHAKEQVEVYVSFTTNHARGETLRREFEANQFRVTI